MYIMMFWLALAAIASFGIVYGVFCGKKSMSTIKIEKNPGTTSPSPETTKVGMLEIRTTPRGVTRIEFTDRYGVRCSLQVSSLASEAAIWFGVNNPDPKVCVPGQGWVPVPLPEGTVCKDRMHLTQDMVKELLPLLQQFAETGELHA